MCFILTREPVAVATAPAEIATEADGGNGAAAVAEVDAFAVFSSSIAPRRLLFMIVVADCC